MIDDVACKGTIEMNPLRTSPSRSATKGTTGRPTLAAMRSSLSTAAAIAAFASAPTLVQAQEQLYDGGKARVHLAAKLRSLSEEVASAGCRVDAQIDADTARADLEKAKDEFQTIIAGLRDGDTALGIPSAETASDNIKSIRALTEAWTPIQAEASRMVEGSPGDLAVISGSFKDLLERAIELTARISGYYSNPQELLQADAITLDYMARQGMFLSRMSREMCGLSTGAAGMASVDELRETVELFDLSLTALRDGFPSAGISPPRSDAVKASLESAYQTWSAKKSIFDAAIGGGAVGPETVTEAVALSKDLSVAMNNTITLHMISSPGQEGVYRVPLQAYAERQLSKWVENPDLIAAINAQNVEHANLSQGEIDALDLDWRAQAKEGGGPLISKLMDRPVSGWLRDQQAATAGFVTEVFVMDNKGLNVAQSEVTSDYWQGDEAKWKETYGNGGGSYHISEVEFDDSTGFYQSQASLPITDPSTGELIGAITFGINVQSLM
jgi:hypothetical protein